MDIVSAVVAKPGDEKEGRRRTGAGLHCWAGHAHVDVQAASTRDGEVVPTVTVEIPGKLKRDADTDKWSDGIRTLIEAGSVRGSSLQLEEMLKLGG